MRRVGYLLRARGGASAVELAPVVPLFLALLLGIVGYGYVLAIGHGLQQLAGEAARASVAGITDAERATLARAFVTANVAAYGVIDGARLRIAVGASATPANTFEVALTYDMHDMVFARVAPWLPEPITEMRRAAVIQRGGY